MPLVKYARLVARYQAERDRETFTAMLRMTGCVAVPRDYLSAPTRAKYADRQWHIGRRVFYVLKPSEVPRGARKRLESTGDPLGEVSGG